jgi:DNA-binding beta-propeller fold protein YncE
VRWWWAAAVVALTLGFGAAPVRADPFAYVASNARIGGTLGGAVFEYDVGAGGSLSPLSPAAVAAGSEAFGVAISPGGNSAYVTNTGSSTVSQYDIDRRTGVLSPKTPAAVASGANPEGLALTPDGKSAYVANNGPTNDISQYSINSVTGALSPKTPAAVAPGATPGAVAVSPDGKSAYVTTNADVAQYDINPVTGALSPKTPATVATGSGRGAANIAVTPDGKSAYVTSVTVSQYNIDPQTGELSLKTPPTVVAGPNPQGVAVTPDSQNAYVTNLGTGRSRTVTQYTIDPVSGRLSPKTPATVKSGAGPTGVAVTPDGKSAYVTNQLGDTVSQYSVGQGGRLSPKSPAAVAAGIDPIGVALSPLTKSPPTPGWEGFVTNRASGCMARVQVPYLDGNQQVTAYTEVVCPRPTKLTIRSRLRSDYPFADITVDQKGCVKGCVVNEPKGERFFRLACPESQNRRPHQRYYSDIVLFPGTDASAATRERSRGKFLSPFCAH